MDYPWTETEKRIFTPTPKIKVSELAAKIRIVTKGPAQGLWTNEFAPYLVEPMDTFNIPWVRKIFLCFAPQTGKTQVALNCFLYCVVIDPGDAFYCMADEKTMKRIMKRQIISTLQATPESKELMGTASADVSQLKINFVNGMELMAAWATSPATMASETARYVFGDEPGKYPDFAGKEADPFALLSARTRTYQHTSKEVYFSTPVLSGDIFDRALQSQPDETRQYNAKCPHCDKLQIMKFRRFHWQGETDPRVVIREKLARYRCKYCEKDWDDAARDYAVKLGRGRWVADKPVERPRAVAFNPLPSWISPMLSMSEAVEAYLIGKQQPGKMQAFVNQHKAEVWKEVINTKSETEILKHRNETPVGVVPSGYLALTAGIDTQKRGFWFVVRAWDAELNSHLVQYGYLATFEDVETLVFGTVYSGGFPIFRAAIDTGGTKGEDDDISRTEEVYRFLIEMRLKYGDRVLYGIKGASRPQVQLVSPERDIDKMPSWKGKKVKGLLSLRTLDTFNLKRMFHDRLSRDEGDDEAEDTGQRVTMHANTGIDYASQIMAEELRKDRNGKLEWVKTHSANHYLDCEVYASACADISWQPGLQYIVRQHAPAQQTAGPVSSGRQVRSRGAR